MNFEENFTAGTKIAQRLLIHIRKGDKEMATNDLWKLQKGYLAAYTEDLRVMKSIRRYYPDFNVMAEYTKEGRFLGLQYRIPMEKRRVAERLFNVKINENKTV